MWVQENAVLKKLWTNCRARLKLQCKIQPPKIVVEKNTPLIMWALFNSLKRRYLLNNPQNRQYATKRKKVSRQNPCAHRRRAVSRRWCQSNRSTPLSLCQVNISVTTGNSSCFLALYSRSLVSSSSFSRTVSRRNERVRQSAFLPVALSNVHWS